MKKELTAFEMRSKGGKALVKKYGRTHMSKIKQDWWDKKKSDENKTKIVSSK